MKFVLKVSCLKLLLYFRHIVDLCTLKNILGLVFSQYVSQTYFVILTTSQSNTCMVFLWVEFTEQITYCFFVSIQVSSEKSNPVRMRMSVIMEIVILTHNGFSHLWCPLLNTLSKPYFSLRCLEQLPNGFRPYNQPL